MCRVTVADQSQIRSELLLVRLPHQGRSPDKTAFYTSNYGPSQTAGLNNKWVTIFICPPIMRYFFFFFLTRKRVIFLHVFADEALIERFQLDVDEGYSDVHK